MFKINDKVKYVTPTETYTGTIINEPAHRREDYYGTPSSGAIWVYWDHIADSRWYGPNEKVYRELQLVSREPSKSKRNLPSWW